MTPTVELVEVGPRDGLQNLPGTLGPGDRAELCRRLAAAGLTRIEAVSFVSAARVPQMALPEEVVAAAGAEGLEGLVLNARGAARLKATGLARLRYAVAVSDAFNERNGGVGAEQGLVAAGEVIADASAHGVDCGAVLATAFGCPFSGHVDAADVVDAAERLAAAGADEIILADTIGVAVPRQVREIVGALVGLGARIGVHLHNTRNTGYACAMTAVEAGVTVLDAAVGGLGGCPFAPGATGNVATEDLVWMLRREGVDCGGVDLEALCDISRWLERTFGLSPEGRQARIPAYPAALSA